jgi:hypothetical protein
MSARESMDFSAAAERGPHPVGDATLELGDPRNPERVLPVDVWYPAAAHSAAPPADHPLGCEHAAQQDPAPAAGPFPLVVFSHGNSGMRRQSTFLTTHLASWGMVVAAPDHSGNTFADMASIRDESERQRVHFEARRNRPFDLRAVIDRVIAGDAAWPAVDEARVGSLGHSYGGWTALKAPGVDPRVGAVCGLAPASEPFVGRKAFEPGELPLADGRPVLVVAGLDDVLIDIGSTIAPLFERLAEPCALVGLERTDHYHFCDSVALLHQMHEDNPREHATRPTLPYADTLAEARIHRILCGLVTRFFAAAFENREAACGGFDIEELQRFDSANHRLDAQSARQHSA